MALPSTETGATPDAMIKQMKEFLQTYNKVTEMCFSDCIDDFRTRKVSEKEQGCVSRCMDKYLKMTQRISLRFAEHQIQLNEGQLGGVSPQLPK